MAKLSINGLELVTDELIRIGNVEAVANRMLKRGAEVMKSSWKKAIKKHDLIDSHAMIDSVGYSRKTEKETGVKSVEVYPKGTDERGVRNAEKAFVNHYGSSSISATHFVDDALEEAEPLVEQEMAAELEKHIQGGK